VSIESTAKKFARLQPRVAKLMPSKGSTGHSESWESEDAFTIASAIGAYSRGKPRRKFPVMLMMLRYWPEGLRPDQLTAMIGITTGMFSRRLQKTWHTVPEPTKWKITYRLDDDGLAKQLLGEFRDPSLCYRCRGLGTVLRITDKDGNYAAPVIIDCPTCGGACTIPMGYKRRAELAGLPARQWNQHVQTHYSRILDTYSFMADRAGAGVMQEIG